MQTRPTKPTQVETLNAIMVAAQIAGHPIDVSIEDANKIGEAGLAIEEILASLHKDNAGPLTTSQLLNFLASFLGTFLGRQVNDESKIAEVIVSLIRTVVHSANYTYRLMYGSKR